MTEPTYRMRSRCELRVRELADYMAASNQRRRSILRTFRYQKIARSIQHKEARISITKWLREGQGDTAALKRVADVIRGRMTASDFEADQNDHNADYIEAFVTAFPTMAIPVCEMLPVAARGAVNLNGTIVVYNPDIAIARTTQKNTRKIGGVFLRYAKGKELPEVAAEFQSAFTFGFLKDTPFEPEAEPEKKLCITIDGNTGKVFEAPGRAVYLWNEMSAACADIAALWPTIEPPPNAILG